MLKSFVCHRANGLTSGRNATTLTGTLSDVVMFFLGGEETDRCSVFLKATRCTMNHDFLTIIIEVIRYSGVIQKVEFDRPGERSPE